MKAYGVPRKIWRTYPDMGDIREFGMSSKVKNRDSFHATRRRFKKLARVEAKIICRSQNEEDVRVDKKRGRLNIVIPKKAVRRMLKELTQ